MLDTEDKWLVNWLWHYCTAKRTSVCEAFRITLKRIRLDEKPGLSVCDCVFVVMLVNILHSTQTHTSQVADSCTSAHNSRAQEIVGTIQKNIARIKIDIAR